MNTKCFFGFHKWTIHPDKLDGSVSKSHWSDISKGYKPSKDILSLHRVCNRCGKRQW